jgi:hypothetical protein
MRRGAIITVVACATGSIAQNGNKVSIPLMVMDSHQRPVHDLTVDALSIKEHKSPVAAPELIRGTEYPLQLGVLIDISRSVHDEEERISAVEALRKFATDALTQPDDRAFFLTFDQKAGATGWLKKEQIAAVPIRTDKGGGTALYDAVAVACRERMGPRD